MNFDFPADPFEFAPGRSFFFGRNSDQRDVKPRQSPRLSLVTPAAAFAIRHRCIYHFPQMVRIAKVVVALVCIACILALCIAPFVDIPVTVIKSIQVLLLLMLSLAGSCLLLVSRSQNVLNRHSADPSNPKKSRPSLPLPLDTNCVQRI